MDKGKGWTYVINEGLNGRPKGGRSFEIERSTFDPFGKEIGDSGTQRGDDLFDVVESFRFVTRDGRGIESGTEKAEEGFGGHPDCT